MTKRQIFLDTETTGLSARNGHRIIELAAIEMVDGELTGRVYHSYYDPQRDIDPYAEQVHGISLRALKGKPKFSERIESLIEFLTGSECIMHNAPFDTGFIDSELELAGHKLKLNDITKVTCTLQLARQNFPGEKATLDALMIKAGLPIIRDKHSALEDANLLADIYCKLFRRTDSKIKSKVGITMTINTKTDVTAMISPEMLKMEKTIELSSSRKETFFYRGMNKRIIDHLVVNGHRWKKINGPLLYAVTDQSGTIRYFGKWVTDTTLYNRWIRHNTIHHQESTRNIYISELDAGRGPLSVWSVSVKEIKHLLPVSTRELPDKILAKELEALWINRWRSNLIWNSKEEKVSAGFSDGEFWKK